MDNETLISLNKLDKEIGVQKRYLNGIEEVVGYISNMAIGEADKSNHFKIEVYDFSHGSRSIYFDNQEDQILGGKPILMAINFIKEEVLNRIKKLDEEFKKI